MQKPTDDQQAQNVLAAFAPLAQMKPTRSQVLRGLFAAWPKAQNNANQRAELLRVYDQTTASNLQ